MSDDDTSPPAPRQIPRRRIGWALLVLVIMGAVLLYPTVVYHLNHVITDDAYVSGNLVAVSTTLSARVEEMVTSTADSVAVGDLIARLEDDVFRADLQRHDFPVVGQGGRHHQRAEPRERSNFQHSLRADRRRQRLKQQPFDLPGEHHRQAAELLLRGLRQLRQ